MNAQVILIGTRKGAWMLVGGGYPIEESTARPLNVVISDNDRVQIVGALSGG